MAITCPVAACDRPMPGSLRICGACTGELTRELEAVPGLAEDLELAISRQTKLGSGNVGGRSTETSLPWNERASEASAILQAVLNGWARTLASTVQKLVGPTCTTCAHPTCEYADLGRFPYHAPAYVVLWLRRHIQALLGHPDAAQAVEDLLAAVRNARHAVDTPPRDLFYAGPCDGCDGDLYAKPGAGYVACRWCVDEDGARLRYSVSARRDWMLQAIEDHQLTAPAIARALTSLIRPIKPALLHTWVSRQRLHPVGLNDKDQMLFRVGDVIDLMMASPIKDGSLKQLVAPATTR